MSTIGAAASAPTHVSHASAQQPEAIEQGAERDADDGEQQARPQHLLRRLPEALQHVLLDDDARNRGEDLRGQRHDERD